MPWEKACRCFQLRNRFWSWTKDSAQLPACYHCRILQLRQSYHNKERILSGKSVGTLGSGAKCLHVDRKACEMENETACSPKALSLTTGNYHGSGPHI